MREHLSFRSQATNLDFSGGNQVEQKRECFLLSKNDQATNYHLHSQQKVLPYGAARRKDNSLTKRVFL